VPAMVSIFKLVLFSFNLKYLSIRTIK
jgi:hypothetical protein